jgi:hypothetical protein
MLRARLIAVIALASLSSSGFCRAQSLVATPAGRLQTPNPFRDGDLFLSATANFEGGLGYYPFPSIEVGLENPATNWLDIRVGSWYAYSPKFITGNGNSAGLQGGISGWMPGRRLAMTFDVGKTWLWTSQFKKQGVHPSVGLVLRQGSDERRSRFYISYLVPTGCVWATKTNPCTIQSGRTQGPQFTWESLLSRKTRFAGNWNVYHFCDQANPQEPKTGRRCHFALTANLSFFFDFRRGRSLDLY